MGLRASDVPFAIGPLCTRCCKRMKPIIILRVCSDRQLRYFAGTVLARWHMRSTRDVCLKGKITVGTERCADSGWKDGTEDPRHAQSAALRPSLGDLGALDRRSAEAVLLTPGLMTGGFPDSIRSLNPDLDRLERCSHDASTSDGDSSDGLTEVWPGYDRAPPAGPGRPRTVIATAVGSLCVFIAVRTPQLPEPPCLPLCCPHATPASDSLGANERGRCERRLRCPLPWQLTRGPAWQPAALRGNRCRGTQNCVHQPEELLCRLRRGTCWQAAQSITALPGSTRCRARRLAESTTWCVLSTRPRLLSAWSSLCKHSM